MFDEKFITFVQIPSPFFVKNVYFFGHFFTNFVKYFFTCSSCYRRSSFNRPPIFVNCFPEIKIKLAIVAFLPQ